MRPRALFAVLLLAFASASTAQTAGNLVGAVADDSGAPLPGVAVEGRGPHLLGSRSAWTDADGRYRLTPLPPGEHEIVFRLAGLADETRTGDASPTPVNPGHGEAVLRTPPTSVRLGVRLSF
jgi:hypothetical protein